MRGNVLVHEQGFYRRRLNRAIHHDPQRPILVVMQQQHHGLCKVRTAHLIGGDQELTRSGHLIGTNAGGNKPASECQNPRESTHLAGYLIISACA